MPAVAAPLFGFALGVVFAWAATEELARREGAIPSQAIVVAGLFGLIVHAPACAYFLAFFPDWTYAYFVDTQRSPAALDLGLVLCTALSPPAGVAALSRAAATRRTGALGRAAAVPALLATAMLLALLPRLRTYATYAQYHGDFGTEPLSGSPVGYALLWMSVIVVAAGAWTIRVLRAVSEPPAPN